jgi:hypothetical protein
MLPSRILDSRGIAPYPTPVRQMPLPPRPRLKRPDAIEPQQRHKRYNFPCLPRQKKEVSHLIKVFSTFYKRPVNVPSKSFQRFINILSKSFQRLINVLSNCSIFPFFSLRIPYLSLTKTVPTLQKHRFFSTC